MAAGAGPHEASHGDPRESGANLSASSAPALAGSHAGHLPARGRALAVSAWLTGIYFLIELAVGLWTGSVAVISDAFHTFSAVGGVLVALLAARIARRPADHARSFGWRRAELIGALANGAFLLVMALVVIVMGAMRLARPLELPTGAMLAVAAGGLVTEVIALALLFRHQRNDLNTRGAWWHVVQTLIGSLIIIIAALVIRFTGFLAIDPILGIAFGLVLLWAGWGILRQSAHLLMEGTPPGIHLPEVIGALGEIPGVGNVHHVHAWALTSGHHLFSAHLRLAPDHTDAAPAILRKAHDMLRRRFGFRLATLQIETECLDESGAEDIDITRPFPPAPLHEKPENAHE